MSISWEDRLNRVIAEHLEHHEESNFLSAEIVTLQELLVNIDYTPEERDSIAKELNSKCSKFLLLERRKFACTELAAVFKMKHSLSEDLVKH